MPRHINSTDWFVRQGIRFCGIAGFCVREGESILFTSENADVPSVEIHILQGHNADDTAAELLAEYHKRGYTRVCPAKYQYICQTEDRDRSDFSIYANAKPKNDKVLVYDKGAVYGTLRYDDTVMTAQEFELFYRPFRKHPCSDIARFIHKNT